MVAVRSLPGVELGYDSDYLAGERAQLITRVLPGSPAERIGMRPGDRLIAIDGKPLADAGFQARTWRTHDPGGTVRLTLQEPGEATPRTVTATFRKRVPRSAEGGLFGYLASQILNSYPVPFIIVGLAVLFLRVDDPKAWLLALVFTGFATTPAFPDSIDAVAPALRPFTRVYQGTLISLFAPLFSFFFAVFPARSSLDRRVPWLKWAALAAGLAVAAASVRTGTLQLPPPLPHLLGQRLADQTAIWWLLAMLTLGMASLATNFLHAADAETRRKTRVIFWGTVVALIPNVGGVAASTLLDYREPDWLTAVRAVFAFLLPLSLAYAVVKHRVLDVPVLLRRSARYLLVQRGFTILLALFSIGVTLAFSLSLAPTLAPLVDIAQPAGVAAGAAFGTLLLWSGSQIHRRVGERIDRAFFRQAYDTRTILQDLAVRAGTMTERSELATLLHRHVADALHPAALAVYVRDRDDRLTLMAGDGPAFPPDPRDAAASAGDRSGGATHATASDAGGSGGAAPVPAEQVVPMVGREGRTLGVLALGARLSEEPYSHEDTTLLAVVANQAALALDNLALAEQIAARLEAERRHGYEIAVAQEVQQKLLPQRMPPLATLDYAGTCTQARAVGGDYYDFLDLGARHVGFVLADVSGKGMAAALLMANLQAIVRSHTAMALGDHEAMLRAANALFHDATASNRFATMFFAKYDDATGDLAYVNCGHNPPLLLRAGGEAEWLAPTAMALGFFEEWTCVTASTRLGPGDLLVMYSDGITEAWSDGGTEYGEARLLEVVRSSRSLPARDLAARIVADVRCFSAEEQSDDWTLIVAGAHRRDGPGEGATGAEDACEERPSGPSGAILAARSNTQPSVPPAPPRADARGSAWTR
jgi:sigma-B regulation protein RsbU (phosphoserine phosphatase)